MIERARRSRAAARPMAGRNVSRRFRALQALRAATLAAVLVAVLTPPAGADSGLDLLSSGDLAGAEHAFQDELRRDPSSAEAHFHLGLVYSRQGRNEDALARFDRALALDPDLADVRLSRGIALYQLGRYREAARAFEEVLHEQPGEPSALLFLGLSRIKLGEPRAAVAPLREAARRDPSLAQLALHNVGLAQWQARDVESAVRSFDEAIALDPNSETADDSRRLRELARSAAPNERSRRWSLASAIGFEYDDNVNQEELDSTTGSGDVLGVFELSPSFRVVDGDRGSVEVGYYFFGNLHDANSDFDLQTHGAFLDGSTELGPVDLGLTYRFDYSMLGGDRFLEIHGLRPSVGFSLGVHGYVDVGYQFQERDFASSRRDAEHHDVGFDGYWLFRSAQGYVSAGYHVVDENADGAEFDFLGHIVRLGVRTPLPVLRGAFATLGYQLSLRDYDSVTPSIGSRRDDRRHSLRLGLEKRIRHGMIAKFDYEFVKSDSNLPSVDFTQNVVGMRLAFDY